jgi:DNA/RNA endonuclease YhcR with UshA esterase domain
MRLKIFTVISFVLISGILFSQLPYPVVPIDSIEWVHPDSLKKADSLQIAGVAFDSPDFPHWIEDSRYIGDTVTVIGVVMNNPYMYALGNRYAVFIMDTAGGEWSGLLILANDTTSPETQATGITVLDTGMVVKIVGYVSEYPSNASTGYTELFTKIPDPQTGQIIPIEVLEQRSRPAPVERRISDFIIGNTEAGEGRINFSEGEKWENVYVIIRNVEVFDRDGTVGGRWFWWITDGEGNVMRVYDGSRYFRGGSAGFDPNWTPPPVGAKLDYIRGIIVYSPVGYAIVPLYPGDIKLGLMPPEIVHAFTDPPKREPSAPTSSDTVRIRAIVVPTDPDTAVKVDTVRLLYSVNYGPFTVVEMKKVGGDTLWEAVIPPQSDGAVVRYFFQAVDTKGQESQLPGDTSASIFFYIVRDRELRIKDIQYTILSSGASGFVDLKVTVRGIVTADTSDYHPDENSSLPPWVFIQDDTAGWSGILLSGSKAFSARRGDSVEVTGIVDEIFGVTAIVVDSLRVISSGNPVPEPVFVRTGEVGFKPGGDPDAEMREGMLIEFRDVSITDDDPDRNNYRYREFVVDDGSGPCRVDDHGTHTYSISPEDTALGYTILYKGQRISYLRGVLTYTFGNYKLEPRKNDDFGEITKVIVFRNPNIPDRFELMQNYPNPFNPSTIIEYRLPERTFVSLKIYNILGQEVVTLINEVQDAGSYRVKFEPEGISSGIYFYVLRAGRFMDVKKMVLLK